MKMTRYFDEQVMRKRPYLRQQWIVEALSSPLMREVQDDGRIRHWIPVELDESRKIYMLRVITLEDGETVHNAFFDRDFKEAEQ